MNLFGGTPLKFATWRLRFAALGLAFASTLGLADAAMASPMTFSIDNSSDKTTLIASGGIEAYTPGQFSAALAGVPVERQRGLTIVLNSNGGDVAAAMQMGAMFRQMRVRIIVARMDPARPGHFRGGFCVSACVYAMMGAERRIARSDSMVGLHRMFIPTGFGSGAHRTAEPELVSEVRHYAQGMGVSGNLVMAAESQVPQLVHIMSRSEMTSWGLVTADAQ